MARRDRLMDPKQIRGHRTATSPSRFRQMSAKSEEYWKCRRGSEINTRKHLQSQEGQNYIVCKSEGVGGYQKHYSKLIAISTPPDKLVTRNNLTTTADREVLGILYIVVGTFAALNRKCRSKIRSQPH